MDRICSGDMFAPLLGLAVRSDEDSADSSGAELAVLADAALVAVAEVQRPGTARGGMLARPVPGFLELIL